MGTKLTKYKLGDLIEPYNKPVGIHNLTEQEVSGINREKEFFEPAQNVGSDTSKYKVVPQNYFACNLMHVGRDCVLPIALNSSEQPKVVSPAYSIFKIRDNNVLLNECFLMMVKSHEMDRYFWFKTDSSVRDGLSWSDFTNISVTIPSLDVQRKYANVYSSLVNNKDSMLKGQNDIEKSILMVADKIKHNFKMINLGSLLESNDKRNIHNEYDKVLGIDITKKFIESRSSSSNLINYKIITNGELGYNSMQTGRDECIRIALYKSNIPALVSPSYSVLKVKTNVVIPEYIQMWFSRRETDRRGAFMTDSSIRSNLDLNTFFKMKIPLPDIDKQKAIVNLFVALNERKELVNKLNEEIKNICPILIRGALG